MIRREPRSKLYDGALYGRLVDPLLQGVHAFVAERAPAGDRVLDACCGTGALARKLAASGREVIGVDLSPKNIAYAQERAPEGSRFLVGDVSRLDDFGDNSFDLATMVLALHEMPEQARLPVLAEVARVARRVMVVDFRVPMPWNVAGLRNRAMEVAAGAEHFRAYRDFADRGGLPALVDRAGLSSESERTLDGGTLVVLVLESSENRSLFRDAEPLE